jgi:hypothetical protein
MFGVVWTCHATAGGGALPGDARPRVWIFVETLTVWVPVSLSFTWSASLLPGHVYLVPESLWCVCM